MRASLLFVVAALLEIGGGYLVWMWLRQGRGALLGVLGFLALALYGVVPVLQDPVHPFGRVYAAYGGAFIAISLLWGILVERSRPDLRDFIGAALCLLGAVVMMWPRGGR